MFYSIGSDKSSASLAHFAGLGGSVRRWGVDERKELYSRLGEYSRFEVPIDWDEPYLVSIEDFERIAPAFCREKRQFCANNSPTLDARLNGSFFLDGLGFVHNVSGDLGLLSSLILKCFVLNHLREYTNGTTQEALGIAFVDFKDHFTTYDFSELVVHQLTHTLLFIDNINYSHVQRGCLGKEIDTELKFVGGGTRFPIYLAFHSYIVAVEVLSFRMHADMAGSSPACHGGLDRIERIMNGFESGLQSNICLLSERGSSILRAAFQRREEVCRCLA